MDNQRTFLEDHAVKIKEIENVIYKLTAEHQEKQTEKGKRSNQLCLKEVNVNVLVSLKNWKENEFVIANNFLWSLQASKKIRFFSSVARTVLSRIKVKFQLKNQDTSVMGTQGT